MDQNNELSKVVFEDEGLQQAHRSFQAPTSKITELVIKYSGGYIKDKDHANYILIGFASIAIVISFFLFFDLFEKKPAVQYREDIPLEIREKLPPEAWGAIPSKFK